MIPLFLSGYYISKKHHPPAHGHCRGNGGSNVLSWEMQPYFTLAFMITMVSKYLS